MSTRRLILTALAAGLAILVAGAVMLLRLNSSDAPTAAVLGVGGAGTASGVTARVDASEAGVATVSMTAAAGEPNVGAGSWRLRVDNVDEFIPDGEATDSCSKVLPLRAAASARCTLPIRASKSSRYLLFTHQNETVVWLLPAG